MNMIGIKRLLFGLNPAWCVTVIFFLITLALSEFIHAPLQLPASSALLFIGFTYLLPFVLISLWLLLPLPFLIFRGELKQTAWCVAGQIGSALCLGTVMWLHFHLKLWAPLINPTSYDSFYETIDRACFSWLDPLIVWRGHYQNEWLNGLYFNVFMLMFLVSFIVHYIHSENEFRRVLLAAILVQAFGALSYLVAPALGPFIYHQGANAHVTRTQQALLHIHQSLVAGGIPWLQHHTSENIAAGLAAMPSLHLAASAVFLYFAQKYIRWLAWVYWPCFLWITFEAMASRWHYGIDLVIGFGLACGCIFLANIWQDAHEAVIGKVIAPESELMEEPVILHEPTPLEDTEPATEPSPVSIKSLAEQSSDHMAE